jgi:hypothetical protein
VADDLYQRGSRDLKAMATALLERTGKKQTTHARRRELASTG